MRMRISNTIKEQQNIAQKDYDQIIRELIPATMDSMGLESVSVDGNSITLQPFVYARITEENKDACFAYLRNRGLDIIKNEVKVTFGRVKTTRLVRFLMMQSMAKVFQLTTKRPFTPAHSRR